MAVPGSVIVDKRPRGVVRISDRFSQRVGIREHLPGRIVGKILTVPVGIGALGEVPVGVERDRGDPAVEVDERIRAVFGVVLEVAKSRIGAPMR